MSDSKRRVGNAGGKGKRTHAHTTKVTRKPVDEGSDRKRETERVDCVYDDPADASEASEGGGEGETRSSSWFEGVSLEISGEQENAVAAYLTSKLGLVRECV
jgi:hypothetical protein